MFSSNQGGFSDELVGLDLAHCRELREITAEAQSIVDRQDARIVRLQRELAATQGRLAASRQSVASLKADRGARNQDVAIQAILRRKRH